MGVAYFDFASATRIRGVTCTTVGGRENSFTKSESWPETWLHPRKKWICWYSTQILALLSGSLAYARPLLIVNVQRPCASVSNQALSAAAATHQSRHYGSVHLWAGPCQIEDKPYRVGVRRAARGRRQSRAGPALGKINLHLSNLRFDFACAARHSHTAELMAPQSQGKLTSCWPLAASGSTRNRSVRKEAPSG